MLYTSKVQWIAYITAAIGIVARNAVFSKTFTSIAKMKTLPPMERVLIGALETYLKSVEETASSETLESFRERADEACRLAELNDQYMTNPINCFHVLLRFVRDWDDVIAFIQCQDCPSTHPASVFSLIANETRTNPFWPDVEDFDGSIVAIARLVHMYDLDLGDLSRGRIKDVVTSPLTARDFVIMGDFLSQDEEMKYEAGMFLKQALITMKSSQYDVADNEWSTRMDELTGRSHVPISAYIIYRKLASIYHNFGISSRAIQVLKEATDHLDLSPQQQKRLEADKRFYEIAKKTPQSKEPRFRASNSKYLAPYWKAYRSQCRDPPKVRWSSNVYCVYWDTLYPLFKVKAEYIRRKPDVVRFYDVMYEDEMEWLKNESFALLHRSVGVTVETSQKMNERISESSWHNDTEPSQLKSVNRRLRWITGFDLAVSDIDTPSESMQVLNYGLGGMYEPHYDSYYDVTGPNTTPTYLNSGDRLATFVLYMSDVKYGGATVFPKLNVKAEAIKGTGILWWNLLRNGSKDLRSLHAGCPVLVGEKWLANKWIRSNAQMWVRPCALNSTL